MRPSRIAPALVAASCLFVASCVHTTPQSTLQRVTQFEAALNTACQSAFTTVATAEQSGLIPTSDAATIINTLVQIEQANQRAQAATQGLTTIAAADQTNLLNILNPLSAAINTAVANGVLGIKDAATKQKVQTALLLIQTTFQAGIALIEVAV